MKVGDVRQLIVTTLHDLGLGDRKPAGEWLLTKGRVDFGCRFDFEGVSVIWLEEAAQVRFLSASGKLLKIIRLNVRSRRKVAKRAA